MILVSEPDSIDWIASPSLMKMSCKDNFELYKINLDDIFLLVQLCQPIRCQSDDSNINLFDMSI